MVVIGTIDALEEILVEKKCQFGMAISKPYKVEKSFFEEEDEYAIRTHRPSNIIQTAVILLDNLLFFYFSEASKFALNPTYSLNRA